MAKEPWSDGKVLQELGCHTMDMLLKTGGLTWRCDDTCSEKLQVSCMTALHAGQPVCANAARSAITTILK